MADQYVESKILRQSDHLNRRFDALEPVWSDSVHSWSLYEFQIA